jgi:RHS repeat-associated protein
VAELSGRTVTYGYDDLYRLTSETIAGASTQNGAVSYQSDSVGNRLQRSSTLPAVPATGLLNYDANDRTSTDPYDANGNLLNGGVGSNVYDSENHMVAAGGVSLVYDGDGNRVKETVAGVATSYLVADQNLTGYAQVLDELKAGAVSRTFSSGLSLINERQSIAGASTASFYGFDGHGSVRFLTSSTGSVTDTYDYDAFGSLISSTGSTPNNYLFAGEQFDPLLGIYYNRARYYDQRQGRFWSMDRVEGDIFEPRELHLYAYVGLDPVDRSDPYGNEELSIGGQLSALAGQMTTYIGTVSARLTLAFAGGGLAVGRLFNQLGEVAENVAYKVITLNPDLVSEEIEEDVAVAEEGIGRSVDFFVRGTQVARQLFLEVKYGLPYKAGPALTRLTAQLQNALDTGRGRVVLWTLKDPGLAQINLVLQTLGSKASEVQFVSGVEGLYRFLELYFRP